MSPKKEGREDKFVNAKLFRRVEIKGCYKDIQKDDTVVDNKKKAETQHW